MSKIVLYWHPMSSATPVACALAELGVPHERVKVDITTGEHWGKSPWLERMVGEMDRFLSARLKAPGR